MWLINTDDFTLHEVHDAGQEHPYAILSHTWDESGNHPLHGEVTFQDMGNVAQACRKSGWIKIERTCQLAKSYRPSLKWAWVDTCCIDKSSSAELTEAINSMFRWYREAVVCFVYLNDLPRRPSRDLDSRASREQMSDFFPRCRWHTRGWTLKELIAPSEVEFYDQTWCRRGTKVSLQSAISSVTGIDIAVLSDSEALSTVPVAQRMCWSSRGRTARLEDAAYSLLGIFDVNMPLIYGEGYKAFFRLQDAIAQQTDDLTLFAWCSNSDGTQRDAGLQAYHGMFAQSPQDFRDCKHIVPIRDPLIKENHSFTTTKQVLQFQESLIPDPDGGGYLMNLYCYNTEIELSGGEQGVLAIRLVKTMNGFARHRSDKLVVASSASRETSPHYIWPGNPTQTNIPKLISFQESHQIQNRFQNSFRFSVQCPSNFSVAFPAPLGPFVSTTHLWDGKTQTFLTGGCPLFTGIAWPQVSGGLTGKFIGWTTDLRIVCGFRAISRDRTSIFQQNSNPMQPCVCLISKENEYLKSINGQMDDGLFAMLEDSIARRERYGHAVSYLGRQIVKAMSLGTNLSTMVQLTAYQLVKDMDRGIKRSPRQDKASLKLQLRTIEEGGVSIHEVIVVVDPLRTERTDPGDLLVIRPSSAR